MTRILVLLPTDGHGGCEYGAMSFGLFARRVLGLDVLLCGPHRPSTQVLVDLAARNGLPWHGLGLAFDADDDAERFDAQRRRMHAVLGETRPDLVFAALPWPARAAGLVAACADAAVPTLVKFALVPEDLYGPAPAIVAQWRRAQAGRQIWFANSRYSAALLERHFELPPHSVDHFPVAPLGLRQLSAQPDEGLRREAARASVRAEFAVPEGALLVVTVGRLAPQKGYETALAAVRLLPGDAPALHFLWVGEGELRQRLQAALRADGPAARITLAGFRRDVRLLLRGSDIFLFPTVYEGGTSQALLEAMDEGLPIVVTRTSAVEEAVADGREALLVEVGDAQGMADSLRRLADDPSLRARLAAASRLRAADFAPERMFKQTLRRIDALLGTRHAEHPSLAGIVIAPMRHASTRPRTRLIDKILSIFARGR